MKPMHNAILVIFICLLLRYSSFLVLLFVIQKKKVKLSASWRTPEGEGFLPAGRFSHSPYGTLNARLFGTRLPGAALVFPQFFEFIHQRIGTGYAPLLKPLGFAIK